MSINPKAIIRVIIEGEWIWVERGTFEVMPLVFVDDDDLPLNDEKGAPLAYFFTSTQGDPYFGPLGSISLMKLDTQLLEETGAGARARGRPAELPEGSGETFGGDVGARAEPAQTDDVAPRSKATKPVPLFADDIDDEDDDDGDRGEEPSTTRRGGLF